jgi:hypothetical protein
MNKILRFTLGLVALCLSSALYAAETAIDFTAQTITKTTNGFTLTVDPFTFTALKNDGQTAPTQNGTSKDLRLYAKNSLEVQSNTTMTSMVFTVSKQGKKRLTDITASTGTVTVDAKAWTVTWTGSASEVTFTVGDKATYGTDGKDKGGQFDVDNVNITTDENTPIVDVAKPTISGKTPFTGSTTVTISIPENTTVYYTTDGSTPNDNGDEYTDPFTISATTTVKAVAYDKAGNASDVVTKEFVMNRSGKGSATDPYTVSEVLALESAPSDSIYITGKVVADVAGTSFNNANYYISDDGTADNQLEVFRGKYIDGGDFTSNLKLTAGDVVVIKGVLTTYNNAYEVAAGSSIVTINGTKDPETVEINPNAKGTENNPYTAGEVMALTTLPVYEVYVSGTVVTTVSGSDQYKNADYYISDNGTENNQLKVFRGKWLGGANFTSAQTLNAGDKVVVKGTLTDYTNKSGVTTREFAQGSQIVSLNGTTTAISSIKSNTVDNAAIYNLAGQRVSKAYKGVVIKNGKKYIVR